MISAAPYRDRVVHHALCNVIAPLFEKKFIYDSYANREGKGTHKAIDRYQEYAKKHRYVLKCDIKKYFPSIDHAILQSIIRKTICCKKTLWLIDAIINNSNPQEPVNDYFSGDTLFTPYERRRGLPIGNLTSQFFANVYLNELDHYVKETLGRKAYIRYVDDFVIFGNDKEELHFVKQRIQQCVQTFRLTLNEDKSIIHPVYRGINFLGFRMFPAFRLLNNKSIVRFKRRMERMEHEYAKKSVSLARVRSSVNGWIGHVLHCSSYRMRKKYLNAVCFTTG
jgi:retron-type reverse transcriptase